MQPHSRPNQTRDPVAASVERALHDLAQAHAMELQLDDSGELQFGEHHASGETHDIAVLRLAESLLDDEQIAPQFLQSLHRSNELRTELFLQSEFEARVV
jgi:hypothetical protein